MNPDDEMKELEKAGVQFRDPQEEHTLEDFETIFGKTEVTEVENAPIKKVTPEELRERFERQSADMVKSEVKREARRQQDRRIRGERWASVTPPVWRDACMDVLPDSIAAACQKWLDRPDNQKWSLVLFGSTGVGKTFTMYAVARELWIDRYDVEIIEVPVFMDLIRPSSDDAGRTFDRMKSVEVLCLDDLGSERISDWTSERLDIILNHRWQYQLPTIVTTNVAPRDLAETLGERGASRLVGGSALVKFTGKDKRING
jgi:DNA replication protein DnaC